MATRYDNVEIIVADNGSTDNSLEVLVKEFNTVTVITNPKNEGFAGGYNWALQKVQADYRWHTRECVSGKRQSGGQAHV